MFAPAVKTEAKLRLAIAGPSGSGKTYTARPVAEALALAEAGHVTGNERHCMVINSKRTTRYSMDCDAVTGVWTCTCPAYQFRPYRIGHTAYCKHTLARAIAERASLISADPGSMECPCCQGTGGFAPEFGDISGATIVCRTCGGAGVIAARARN